MPTLIIAGILLLVSGYFYWKSFGSMNAIMALVSSIGIGVSVVLFLMWKFPSLSPTEQTKSKEIYEIDYDAGSIKREDGVFWIKLKKREFPHEAEKP